MIKVFHSQELNKGTITLNILKSGYAQLSPPYSWEVASPPFAQLYYMQQGEQSVEIANETFIMKEGYMYLLPTAMAAKSSVLSDVKELFFHVNLFDFTGLDLLTSCRMTAGIPCEEIESLIALYQSPNEADLFILRNRISLDIARFLKETGVTVEFQNHSASVIMAVDYIKSHLSANLSVAEICEQLFISKNTLNHYFRQELGQSIGKYIDNLIMEKAKILLLNQTLSLGEISSRLGFCDQFYFSRKFKEKCGETPSAYRKKNIRFDM